MSFAKSTPEQIVKNMIFIWLQRQRWFSVKKNACFVFNVKTMGTYDAAKKVYRKLDRWSIKGTADIVGIWKGRPLAIEVKRPASQDLFKKSDKGRASPEQKKFIEDWTASGGIGFFAWSLEDVKRELEAADRGEKYVWEGVA